ncbi:MAG: nucleotidyltransferase domain-containing protein [Rhodospirillales bacterium]|nr:nucleotidyltransferase domain-containing protein [Rhodospirillales bacterium]
MNTLGDARLERLLDRVVTAMRPEAVYLFGSHARGEADRNSDYDLLVIVPDDCSRERRSLTTAATLPRDPGVPADVIPCRRSVFERRRHQVGTLCHRATREGRLIYGA